MKTSDQLMGDEKWLNDHLDRMEMRERDILACLTEGVRAIWIPWALGIITVEELAKRHDCRIGSIRREISRAQVRLRAAVMEVPE